MDARRVLGRERGSLGCVGLRAAEPGGQVRGVGFCSRSGAVRRRLQAWILPLRRMRQRILQLRRWNMVRGGFWRTSREYTTNPVNLSESINSATCPVILGSWERYRIVIELLAGFVAAALATALFLALLVRLRGGTLAGSAALLAGLVLWSIAALQTVSQAAAATSTSLPSVISFFFRGLALLQLKGVLVPPECVTSLPISLPPCACTTVTDMQMHGRVRLRQRGRTARDRAGTGRILHFCSRSKSN